MKTLIGMILIALTATVACADESTVYLSNVTTGAVAETAVTTQLNGYLEQVEIVGSGDLTNATVTITVDPYWTEQDEVTLYSSTNVVADTVLRPRFDGTDTAGAALASDDPWRYYLNQDKVKISVVSAASTNMNIRLRVKTRP